MVGGPLYNTLANETPKNMSPRSKMVKGQTLFLIVQGAGLTPGTEFGTPVL